ncbi:hypothetical protein B0H14DRAFT_3506433 [Mycena olivaceomarginata]|nr:hypothetical protein B0H14DRAFT_3506433 [Mycena olivaceomarginata]
MDSIRLASSTASARAPPRRLRHDFRRLSTPCPPMALEQLGIMNGLLRFAPSPRRLRGNNRRRTPLGTMDPTRPPPSAPPRSSLARCLPRAHRRLPRLTLSRRGPPPASLLWFLPSARPAEPSQRELALILDSSMVGAIEHTHTVVLPRRRAHPAWLVQLGFSGTMLDATLLTSPRWTRAPLSCNRCGVPARVDAASRSGCAYLLPSSHRIAAKLPASSQQYPSTPDPTDIAYFLVVVHLRDGHDSTTLAWLVTSTLRLPLVSAPTPPPRLHCGYRHLPPVPRNRRVPPACLPHLCILGILHCAPQLTVGGTRPCLALCTLRTTMNAGRALCAHSRCCAVSARSTFIRVRLSTSIWTSYCVTAASTSTSGSNFGLPVDRREPTPVQVAAPAAARQTPLARPTPHHPSGLQTPIKTPAASARCPSPRKSKPSPRRSRRRGRDKCSRPPFPGRPQTQTTRGDDSFGFFSDDDAFLACVDMGEGDLGQPIDFEEGASSVSVGDEEKAVEAARSLPANRKPNRRRIDMGRWQKAYALTPRAPLRPSRQEWEHRRPKPVFTERQRPLGRTTRAPASVARGVAIANQLSAPSTSDPNQQAPSEPEGGASTGGASTSALPPQQKRPSTPSVCGFHFPPGMPNPLLQNNGRPPPQGVKRGADAMMCELFDAERCDGFEHKWERREHGATAAGNARVGPAAAAPAGRVRR